ncbi:MAG TPA: hypothetical protein VF322_13270 [Gammaproteobacteria bacterium]
MATVAHEGRPQHERRYHERRRGWPSPFTRAEGMRVSWGGIFGGVLVALGVLMLLSSLGLAVGISAMQPGETEASTVGTGAGIWGAISMLIALFVGGWTATRIGAITDRTTGFFEGALVWVVSVLLMAYFAASGIGALAGGAFRVAGGATQAIGQAVQSQGGVDIDTSGSIDQIAQRLRDPQTAQRIAQLTGLPQDQVQQTLNQTAQRVQGSDNPAQAAQEAQRGAAQLMEQARSSGALERRAQEIQPEASAAAWVTFIALLLSLAAAVIGAMVGRRKPEAVQQAQPAM